MAKNPTHTAAEAAKPTTKPAATDVAAEMVQVTMLSPVDHDGQRHEIGASLDIPAAQAAALIAAGAAEATGGAAAAPA